MFDRFFDAVPVLPHWVALFPMNTTCLNDIFLHSGILITAKMAMHMNNAHIIYHHMDAA